MGDEGDTNDVSEIVLVNTEEASFQGSSYDASLQVDTTPAARVRWPAEQPSEQRSVYDAKLIVDTTPATLPELTTLPEPTTTSDSGTDGAPVASSD